MLISSVGHFLDEMAVGVETFDVEHRRGTEARGAGVFLIHQVAIPQHLVHSLGLGCHIEYHATALAGIEADDGEVHVFDIFGGDSLDSLEFECDGSFHSNLAFMTQFILGAEDFEFFNPQPVNRVVAL